jgi:hypothetical protein
VAPEVAFVDGGWAAPSAWPSDVPSMLHAATTPGARTKASPASGKSAHGTAGVWRRAPWPSAGSGTAATYENSTSNGPKDARSCTEPLTAAGSAVSSVLLESMLRKSMASGAVAAGTEF